MTERIRVERIDTGVISPFFTLRDEDHIKSEQIQSDIVWVGHKPVELNVFDIGNIRLQSWEPSMVHGTYDRKGRSTRILTPQHIESEEILQERIRFTITNDHWVEFITWKGDVKTRLSLQEDRPEEIGAMVIESSPDPDLETSIQLEIPEPVQLEESGEREPALI